LFCHLDRNAAGARLDLEQKHDPAALISYMESELFVTPLDLLARAAIRPQVSSETAQALFDSYDGFLSLLDNDEYRNELRDLLPDQVGTSKVWRMVRELGKGFQSGLTSLFYGEDEELKNLTIEYGVF
jgi:hypothetical protein